MKALLAVVVFSIFCFVSILGLPMLLSHSEHHIGCPLQAAQTVMCESSIIEHFSMWQAMFASVISSFVLLVGIAGVIFASFDVSFVQERVRIRLRTRGAARPTLMQELFSQGILNRKEPYTFS